MVTAIQSRDAAVVERDAAIAARDAAVAECQAAVAECQTAVAECQAAVADRDAALREHDAAVHDKEAAERERTVVVAERDALLQEQESLVLARNRATMELNMHRSNARAELASQLAKSDEDRTTERIAFVAERDAAVAEMKLAIAGRDSAEERLAQEQATSVQVPTLGVTLVSVLLVIWLVSRFAMTSRKPSNGGRASRPAAEL